MDHETFKVTITLSTNSKLLKIFATAVEDVRDYFEIKVTGEKEVSDVMGKFRGDFELMAKSLRIMNDAMVLISP